MQKIVVGVDGSETAQRALEWAATEAQVRGAGLVVVHAWLPLAGAASPYSAVVVDPASIAETARLTLADSVESLERAGLEVARLDQVLVQGPAARALIEVARDSSLLVVGSRGRGGITGLLLGSVSRQIAQYATVPVVIIPPAYAERPDAATETSAA
ncbi:universal stress protein [Kribbella sp. CA-253562]|uniref:universal stress protein n=1 Tax=Kribbella sp. CA-253562 TaxID=3239942 RepID=UPI003D8A2A90